MNELLDSTKPSAGARRRSHWSSRLMPVLVLAVGVAGLAWLSRQPAKAKLPPAVPQPLRTQVARIEIKDYPVRIPTHGVVRAHNESTLSAQVSARVRAIQPQFEDGAFFNQGDLLLELEPDDYRTALAIAEARAQSTKAALELAGLSHRRTTEMLKGKLVPEAQADETAALLKQAQAENRSAEAQVDRARRDLERTQIRAPFNGCVRRRLVGIGQLVGPGTVLGQLFAIDVAEVRLPISKRELQHLNLPESPATGDLSVELQDAVAPDPAVVWRGRVVRAEGALDDNSLDLFVIVQVADPFGRQSSLPPLRPGQPVTASILGKTLAKVAAIPRKAVRELDRVYLVDERSLTLTSKRISPLWSDEGHVVTRDPAITHGCLVATTHLVYAPDGAKVEILPDVSSSTTASNVPNSTVPSRLKP